MIHSGKSITHFCFLVIIFFCISAPAFGEINVFGQSYCFTLSGGPGFLYGTSYEIVYRNSGSKEYLSELQWNFKPLFFLGLNLDFAQKNPKAAWGFFTGIGLKAGLTMETGFIEDRDWISPSTVPSYLTHFSSHENHTKAAFLINLNSGFSFSIRNFIIKLLINFDYMYFKWEAWNGYLKYGAIIPGGYTPWNDPSGRSEPTYGLGISYVQHWILVSAGIGADFILNRFTLSANFLIGPSYCLAIDEHHKRNLQYTDYLNNGVSIKPKLGAFFSFSDRFDFGITAAYHYIWETRGHTIEKLNGITIATRMDHAGARFQAIEGNIVVKYKL